MPCHPNLNTKNFESYVLKLLWREDELQTACILETLMFKTDCPQSYPLWAASWNQWHVDILNTSEFTVLQKHIISHNRKISNNFWV